MSVTTNTIKFFIWSDLHADEYIGDRVNAIGESERLLRVRRVIKNVWQIIHDNSCGSDIVYNVFLGDLFNLHKISGRCFISAKAQAVVAEEFKKCFLLGSGLPSDPKNILLAGNHDLFYKGGSNVLRSMFEPGEFLVISTPKTEIVNNIRLNFLPYMSNKEANIKIKEFASTGILFTHLDVDGAEMSNNFKMRADKWSVKNRTVFNGHIHRRQTVGNINCVGAVMENRLSDVDGKPKGVTLHVVDPMGENLATTYTEFIPLEESNYKLEIAEERKVSKSLEWSSPEIVEVDPLSIIGQKIKKHSNKRERSRLFWLHKDIVKRVAT